MLRRSVSEGRIVGLRVDSQSREATWALTDHAYAARPPCATRHRQASLPTVATPSRWTPPVMPEPVDPPRKRRRLDTATYQFCDGASNNGDSFRTPYSAVYNTPPDACSVTSAGGPLDPLQSCLSTDSTQQTGCGNSQLTFTRDRPKEHSEEPFLSSASPQQRIWTVSPNSSRGCASPCNTRSPS